jgi:hypothetical protein
MHKVAIASSITLFFFELTAASLSKVRDWRVLHMKQSPSIVPTLQSIQSLLGTLFVLVLDVDVPHQMVSQILTHNQFQHLSKLGKFIIDLFTKLCKVFLFVRLHQASIGRRNRERGLIHVWNQNRLRETGTVVETGTTVSMTTRPDLVVERTIDSELSSNPFSSVERLTCLLQCRICVPRTCVCGLNQSAMEEFKV